LRPSLRHETFVAEFLKDDNAIQAYIRAGISLADPSGPEIELSDHVVDCRPSVSRREGQDAAPCVGRP
jgi:hypothetical protein